MSFRVGTPNYGLPQTEGTDKRDWSDTNQPFLAIDTAIKTAVDTSASASSAAATAQQTADGANTAAAHAQTDATTAQTLATSATELATLAKNTADSAKTESTANTSAINQINSDLTVDVFGTLVSVRDNTSSNPYITTTDGYVTIYKAGSSTAPVGIKLTGSNSSGTEIPLNVSERYESASMFVKKGCRIYTHQDDGDSSSYALFASC